MTEGTSITSAVSAAASMSASPLQEVEGVFVIRQGRVQFAPLDTGIAGDRYFEAVAGLSEGDLVVTGPFNVVRDLQDGDAVQVNERAANR